MLLAFLVRSRKKKKHLRMNTMATHHKVKRVSFKEPRHRLETLESVSDPGNVMSERKTPSHKVVVLHWCHFRKFVSSKGLFWNRISLAAGWGKGKGNKKTKTQTWQKLNRWKPVMLTSRCMPASFVFLSFKNLDRKVSCFTDRLTLLEKNALLEYFNQRDSTN